MWSSPVALIPLRHVVDRNFFIAILPFLASAFTMLSLAVETVHDFRPMSSFFLRLVSR
jgi:hypothetical protein